MRILHVVPYVSRDGAYGGPVTVAATQAAALAQLGHDVELWAGWDGLQPLEISGVETRLFRVFRPPGGFSSMFSLGMQRAISKASRRFDVVHVHSARDLITTPACAHLRSVGVPYLMQPHGMIMPDSRIRARIWDLIWVRRNLRAAHRILGLTEAERFGLKGVAGSTVAIDLIPNGIELDDSWSPPGDAERDDEIVFLARLQKRKGVMAFAAAAAAAHESIPDVKFAIYGPDEGELDALQRFIAGHPAVPIEYRGAVPPGSSRDILSKAMVYVLPSQGEVFPMTVLEAMAAGAPVVLGVDCGIAKMLEAEGAATIVEPNPDALSAAIVGVAKSASTRDRLRRNSLDLIKNRLTAISVSRRLTAIYELALASRSHA